MIQKRRGPFSRSISTQNRGEIYFLRSNRDKNVESPNVTLGHAILNYGRPPGHAILNYGGMGIHRCVCLLFKKNKD